MLLQMVAGPGSGVGCEPVTTTCVLLLTGPILTTLTVPVWSPVLTEPPWLPPELVETPAELDIPPVLC